MYVELFKKLGRKKENLSSYTVSDLEAFNDTVTHPQGFVELMVTFREGGDTKTYIFRSTCKSVYKDILERSFVATIDIMVSVSSIKDNKDE